MKITIKHVANGYIVGTLVDDIITNYVFEEDEDTDEVETFANVLRALEDLMGPSTSRYSAKRVYVRIEPGDKFEDNIYEELEKV